MHTLKFLLNTLDIFLNSLDISVAQDAILGDSQVLLIVHLLVALAPVGPLGHDTLTVLSDVVTGHSNVPRSVLTVLSMLQALRAEILNTYYKIKCIYDTNRNKRSIIN